MAVDAMYAADVEQILSHRYDNGSDLWATPDVRLIVGAPFSTLESALYLVELGMSPDEPILKDVAALIFSAWRADGRFRLYPTGTIYPCQTIHAADALCRMGYAADERIQATFRHLVETRHIDGGWRCNKFSFGRGPETECSNPFPTLVALDAFRYSVNPDSSPEFDGAVDFLLSHWTIRKPIGPCHYGIGTLFMQVEYPFRNYNLFYYVYVLSFYARARKDARFLEAFTALESKARGGQIVVERAVPKLANLAFCKKGEQSELATKRYRETLENMRKG
jgi:hypothetical protein